MDKDGFVQSAPIPVLRKKPRKAPSSTQVPATTSSSSAKGTDHSDPPPSVVARVSSDIAADDAGSATATGAISPRVASPPTTKRRRTPEKSDLGRDSVEQTTGSTATGETKKKRKVGPAEPDRLQGVSHLPACRLYQGQSLSRAN